MPLDMIVWGGMFTTAISLGVKLGLKSKSRIASAGAVIGPVLIVVGFLIARTSGQG